MTTLKNYISRELNLRSSRLTSRLTSSSMRAIILRDIARLCIAQKLVDINVIS